MAFVTMPVALFKTFIGPAYLLEDGLFDKYYNYALFMSNLQLLITLQVTRFFLKVFKSYKTSLQKIVKKITPKWKVKRSKMFFLSFLFLFLFFLSFYILSTNSLGFINWIISPRTGYQFHRTGAGQYYALALLFLSTSFSLRLLFLKKTKNILLFTILYIIFSWLLGSKHIILNFCIYTIIILWFRQFKHLGKFIRYFTPIIFIPMLLNFGSFDLNDVASYFDYYVNSAMYFKEYFTGNIDLFWGEIRTTEFWALFPRSIFPDKPYVYGFLLVNEHFFPGAAEATHTPAFGGPIASFADFGVLGVIWDSLFNFQLWFQLLCYHIVFTNKNIETLKSNPIYIYVFLLLFAPNFLQFLPFPLSLITFLFLSSIISFINRVVIKIHQIN